MNSININGRLLRDPRYFDSANDNAKRLNFTISTDTNPRGDDTLRAMDVTVFGITAAQLATDSRCKTGCEVYLSGRLQANPQQAFVEDPNKTDDQGKPVRYTREVYGIVCQGYGSVSFGRPGRDGASNGVADQPVAAAAVADDEAPF